MMEGLYKTLTQFRDIDQVHEAFDRAEARVKELQYRPYSDPEYVAAREEMYEALRRSTELAKELAKGPLA